MQTTDNPIGIIGAGPAGLTVAYALAQKGKKVILIEASNRVGGMSASFDLWGQKVDLGPHRFFSKNEKVKSFWLQHTENKHHTIHRLTRIYFKKKFFYYPLQTWNAFVNLGFLETIRCLISYGKQKIIPIQDHKTFETWVIRRFGKRLYQHFFQSYTEKLWGMACSQLDEDFAAQRIKKLSLSEAIKNALGWRTSTEHATLIDTFIYPKEGAGQVYEHIYHDLLKMGVEVKLETSVEKILVSENQSIGIKLTNGEEIMTSHLISTMPLTQAVQRMENITLSVQQACEKLRFRNTVLVYLKINQTQIFPDQWMYIHDADLQMGRITNFSNWKLKTPEQTILCIEFWCHEKDESWIKGEEYWGEIATKEIIHMGLVQAQNITDKKVVKIPKCYPIYERNYKENLQIIVDFVKTIQNLTCIGRYGSFKYNNQDHSILMGLCAAENIMNGSQHDLWAINTDYETYQE